jgi:hypothetical protein
MNSTRSRHASAAAVAVVWVVVFSWGLLGPLASTCRASAFVRGAYYRLGEDDAGASAGAVGNDPTTDSFTDHLDLGRFGSPAYSADVPARGPAGDKLSMQFPNSGAGVAAFYGRSTSASMVEQGFALEAWAKAGTASAPASLIAYNGDPAANGFGLFQDGGNYVARIGSFERVLGPADAGAWHHLAYVFSLGSSSYYYDGKEVAGPISTDPIPATAAGGLWVGGQSTGGGTTTAFPFNGLVDEVRYQSYNPIAAGAFDPTDFLISAPEPGSLGMLAAAAVPILLARRRRRQASL